MKGCVIDGLSYEIGGIPLEGPDGQFHFSERSGDDNFLIRPALLDSFQYLDTVHPGHTNIGDNDMRSKMSAGFHPGGVVFGRYNLKIRIFKGQGCHFANIGLIIDKDDFPKRAIGRGIGSGETKAILKIDTYIDR